MENQLKELKDFVDNITSGTEIFGKSGLKLLALCILLKNVNWQVVDKFALKWEVIEAGTDVQPQHIPVPIVYITMNNGTAEAFVGDETILTEAEEDKDMDNKN